MAEGASAFAKCLSFCPLIFVMPIVTVAMYSGKSQAEKDRLAEAITDDIAKILKIDKKEVVIVFQEAPHGNWYSSGIRL
jgi:4-oxalocrotonate tautomerase